MKIDLGTNLLGLNIPELEKYYGAKYVGDFPLIAGEDKFADQPVSVFWRPKILRTANNTEYFGITRVVKRPFGNSYDTIEASYVSRYIFNGLEYAGKVIYSRHETDKRSHDNQSFIEGGFTKRNWSEGKYNKSKLVRLQVIDGVITILPDKK